MRNTFLVCYDICDDRRLAKVYKTMRGFGDHTAAPLTPEHADLLRVLLTNFRGRSSAAPLKPH